MPFRKEPAHPHGTPARSAIVLVNLGTPDAPTRSAVKRYLKQFLSDPRVVEIPRLVWWCILNCIILPFRSGASAKKYQMIWTREGSPLKVHTQKQAIYWPKRCRSAATKACRCAWRCATVRLRCRKCSTSSRPNTATASSCCRPIRSIPAPRPPRSRTPSSTTIKTCATCPSCAWCKHYHDHDGYIDALHDIVQAHWDTHGRGQKLVMSFHGVPKRTLMLGDPYYCECQKTARLLAEPAAPGAGRLRRHLPVALRQGRVAAALHGADRAGAGARRGAARGRDLPGVHQRLPGNPGRDFDGSQTRFRKRGRQGISLHPLPERVADLDRGRWPKSPNST